MGSQSNGLPAVAPVVPSTIEEPGTSLVPQEVHPPQEALLGDRRIFIHVPQFHWHDYSQGAMDVDRDARNQIMDLAYLLHFIWLPDRGTHERSNCGAGCRTR